MSQQSAGRKSASWRRDAPAPVAPAAAADAIESSTARVASELQLGGAAGDPSAPKVGIIMGSDSDLATMKAAAEVSCYLRS